MGNIWEDIYQGPLSEIPWLKTESTWLTAFIKSTSLPRGKAIDLGCGTGVNSVALAKTGNFTKVLGLDISPTAIHYANNLAKQNSLNNICEFRVVKLPDFTPNNDYELILDWAFIHCLKPSDHKAYAALIERLSKRVPFCSLDIFHKKTLR